jgi:hypothetical protein
VSLRRTHTGRHITLPELNARCLSELFDVESITREFLIEHLTAFHGQRWFDSQLDAKTLDRIHRSVSADKEARWTRSGVYSPIYYLHFPVYAQIIESGVNWNPIFRHFFKRKDIATGIFRMLEPIRNKLAHNRLASMDDLSTLQQAKTVLLNCLGDLYAEELLNRVRASPAIADGLLNLHRELNECKSSIVTMTPASIETFRSLAGLWWLSALYLDDLASEITSLYELIGQYNALPRTIGQGYVIRKWLGERGVDDFIDDVRTKLEVQAELFRHTLE